MTTPTNKRVVKIADLEDMQDIHAAWALTRIGRSDTLVYTPNTNVKYAVKSGTRTHPVEVFCNPPVRLQSLFRVMAANQITVENDWGSPRVWTASTIKTCPDQSVKFYSASGLSMVIAVAKVLLLIDGVDKTEVELPA